MRYIATIRLDTRLETLPEKMTHLSFFMPEHLSSSFHGLAEVLFYVLLEYTCCESFRHILSLSTIQFLSVLKSARAIAKALRVSIEDIWPKDENAPDQ